MIAKPATKIPKATKTSPAQIVTNIPSQRWTTSTLAKSMDIGTKASLAISVIPRVKSR